jgi:hypothetical protein
VHVHFFPCASLLDPHPSSSVVHPYGFVIRRSNRPYQVSCNDSGVPIDLYFHITRLERLNEEKLRAVRRALPGIFLTRDEVL